MVRTAFQQEKALNALLYVASKSEDNAKHALFKALYFAERQHLLLHAAPIIDDFVKMEYGPVPSFIYDLVKVAEGKSVQRQFDDEELAHIKQAIRHVPPYSVEALAKPRLSCFTADELASMDFGIACCKGKGFGQRVRDSHDKAWEKATYYTPMTSYAIAKANGASGDVLEHLEAHAE